jgi:sarcosine oxidase
MITSVRADYVVIGGGLTGLATAWALARRRREVTVLEQAVTGHQAGGSHGSCRIFRFGYEDPMYVSLARQARELWTELEQSCGERLLHPVPQLTFGPQMPQVRDAMAYAGESCRLLSAGEAAERFPDVAVPGDVLLEPDSAVIAAERALAALAGCADPGGRAHALPGTRVTSLADDGRRVRVSTSAGDVEARRAVVCAGPWTSGLLATAGITIPGHPTLEQVAYLAPARTAPDLPAGLARTTPIFVHYGGDFPYGLPVPDTGRYKIGLHHGGPPVHPDSQHQQADPALNEGIERAARRFLPGFDPRPQAIERCVYDNSPDEDFIIGRIGNIVIGSGTSGHGFKFGPLLGEWLATLATDSPAASAGPPGSRSTATGFPPSRLAPGRFLKP